jgi:hypothetical protein
MSAVQQAGPDVEADPDQCRERLWHRLRDEEVHLQRCLRLPVYYQGQCGLCISYRLDGFNSLPFTHVRPM